MVILNLLTWDENEDMSEDIIIHPLAEGAGKLVITGFSDDSEDFLKILVHVKI